MDRIANIFAARKPLVIFTSVGYPTEEQSEQAVCAAIEKGADIIELGVPFSDPMADGPVISAASQVAIKEGMTLPKTIAFAARLRAKYPQTGLILFSYMNPLLHIGYDAVCQQLADAGVDGILPVDLPLEERGELLVPARAHGLHVIPLVSPLTPEDRVAKIVEGMTGFVYYINVAGVTGARDTLPQPLREEHILKSVNHALDDFNRRNDEPYKTNARLYIDIFHWPPKPRRKPLTASSPAAVSSRRPPSRRRRRRISPPSS